MTLVGLLRDRSHNYGDRVGYEFLGMGESVTQKLTYRELDSRARQVAIDLQDRNLKSERVLLLYPPGIDYVIAFFGCLYAGAIAVPTYPPRRLKALRQLHVIAANSSAKLVLTTKLIRSKFHGHVNKGGVLSDIEWLSTDENLSSTIDWEEPEISSDTLAFLQYTSGSTANPKGAMVSHGNILHNLELIYRCFGHSQKSKGVIWLPPYHDMGLIGGILQPLYGAFPVALMSPINFLQNPLSWLKLISSYRGTTSGGPDFAYQLCIEKAKYNDLSDLDLSSWEVAFNGSEPVRAKTLKDFSKIFGPYGFNENAFYPCYGMAESTLIITGRKKESSPVIRNWDNSGLENGIAQPNEGSSVGQISTLVSSGCSQMEHEVIIVNPKTLSHCPTRTIGEIWISGTSVTQGYWNAPRKTEHTFKAYLKDSNGGPFLRTGDLGFLDHDHELFVVGRLRDLITIGRQKFYPLDIEKTVEQSHYALRPRYGAAISIDVNGVDRLVVIQEVKRSLLRKLNTPEITSTVRQVIMHKHQLAPYAIVLIKTGSLPKTSSGKVKRHACKQDFLSNSLIVIGDWAENPVAQSKFRALESEIEEIIMAMPKTIFSTTN